MVLFSMLAVCCCQHAVDHKDHGHHHGHHHYYDLFFYKEKIFWYFIFLAFKIKAVFVLGTIFTVSMVAGKVFALVKYIDYMKKQEYHHHGEKVVYINAHDHHSHHDFGDQYGAFSAPAAVYQGRLNEYHGQTDGLTNEPPVPSENIDKKLVIALSPGGGYSNNYRPFQMATHGRSWDNENGIDWYSLLYAFKKMIRRSDISETAFREMGIKTDNCKKKFVCDADIVTKQSILLKAIFEALSDESYEKYRSEENEGDCTVRYSECMGGITI
ncbi:uncharacterized protein LOC132706409 [Cylas formicarius]|uniref:uncharacterized protein LOC132706409 n=1 Tax=Cylas formicarius TaxID=197179 RepID=UPI00295894C3|nr:uncharacterized protein LOC132706409 [Cylas formicarius]